MERDKRFRVDDNITQLREGEQAKGKRLMVIRNLEQAKV